MEIKNILSLFEVPVETVEDVIISSVVPPVFNAVRTGAYKVTGLTPMVVGPGIKTGLNIQMDNPASVGSDLIVAAVAAAGEAGELTKLPDNAMMRMFLNPMPINSLPTLLGEGGKKIAQFMVDEYAKLAK